MIPAFWREGSCKRGHAITQGMQSDCQGSGLGWLLFRLGERITTMREQWYSTCPVPSKLLWAKHSRNTRFMLFCLSSGGCKSLATPGQVPCDQVSSSCHPILQCTQTLGEGGVPSVNRTWHLPSVSIRRHPGIQESGGWLSAGSSWGFQGMGQEGSKIPTRSGG